MEEKRIITLQGHYITMFFNHTTNLLVIDVIDQNGMVGNEILRRHLDFKTLLSHVTKPKVKKTKPRRK